jgi:hypothetical protein
MLLTIKTFYRQSMDNHEKPGKEFLVLPNMGQWHVKSFFGKKFSNIVSEKYKRLALMGRKPMVPYDLLSITA